MKQNSFKTFYVRRISLLLWPSIQHLDTSTMFYRSTTIGSIHISILYPSKLEIKDSIESSTSVSYLDVLLNVNAGGKLTTQMYDKRDDFSFTIVNSPYICSNIPLSPAYEVYISQLIRYARACYTYDQFLSRGSLLTDKLMLQKFIQSHLMSAFCKFYGRYNDLIHNYKLSLSHMLSVIFHTNS
jgi:hypothetical protein